VRVGLPTISSGGVWYTDANGREMQLRRRDYRPTWDLKVQGHSRSRICKQEQCRAAAHSFVALSFVHCKANIVTGTPRSPPPSPHNTHTHMLGCLISIASDDSVEVVTPALCSCLPVGVAVMVLVCR
jgi:hypothetical protein